MKRLRWILLIPICFLEILMLIFALLLSLFARKYELANKWMSYLVKNVLRMPCITWYFGRNR